MNERIVGNPEALEDYTERTQATLGPVRESLFDYWIALRAFLSAEPNDFGDGGIASRSPHINEMVKELGAFDATPAAFAFALRQLDHFVPAKPGERSWLATEDLRRFDTFVEARLDNPFATPAQVAALAVGADVLQAGMAAARAAIPMTGESALLTVLAHFHALDAASDGRPDGRVSTSDLEAIRTDPSLSPELRDAASHLLESPTLLHLVVRASARSLIAGGMDAAEVASLTSSEYVITGEGIIAFLEANQSVKTVGEQFALFDTAANGEADKYVSMRDLEAVATNQALPVEMRQASRWLLDHPEEIALLERYELDKRTDRLPPLLPFDGTFDPDIPDGFAYESLVGRVVDGQAFGVDVEGAERFVNGLPVADGGQSGLPIWLCSTDGVRALANAALFSARGDLTDQHSVIAHLPETEDAIRNELITAFYVMLAPRVDRIFAGGLAGDPSSAGHPGANWLIYAPWASNGIHDVITGEISVFTVNVGPYDRQSGADGNQWIFNDVGARFAALVELYEDSSFHPSPQEIESFFLDNFQDGEAEIRTSFAAYVAATHEPDPVKRQILMFQANTLVAAHEQAGVQPYLEGVGDWYIPDWIEARYIDVRNGPYLVEVDEDVPDIAQISNLALRNNHIVGMDILDLDPGGKRPQDFSQPGLRFGTAADPHGPDTVRLPEISGIEGFPTSTSVWHEEGGELYELRPWYPS